jgi:molybdenum cofactor biosynthesis enzyme MoaA
VNVNLRGGKGRIPRKLTISATDTCNFACLFMLLNKGRWIPDDRLSFEAIIRIIKALSSLVSITGKEIEYLVRTLQLIEKLKTLDITTKSMEKLKTLDITTNGSS